MIVSCKDKDEVGEELWYIGCTKCNEMIERAQSTPSHADPEYMMSLKTLGETFCKGGEEISSDYVFEVEKQNQHNVKMTSDTNTCSIAGMCGLASGELLVADDGNSKLKLLNSSYEVVGSYNVSGRIIDLCSTGQREAAMLVDNCFVLLVRVEAGKIETVRTIHGLDLNDCTGLAYQGGKLYIAAMFELYVYDMESKIKRMLYRNEIKLGDATALTVSYCAISPGGSRICFTDKYHGRLMTINQGDSKYQTKDLPSCNTVHITWAGHVFVSCYNSDAVVQIVERDGKQAVRTLVGMKDGLTKPSSMFFNSITNSLLVSQHGNDNIVEFELK